MLNVVSMFCLHGFSSIFEEKSRQKGGGYFHIGK